jgi:hypothetical protein
VCTAKMTDGQRKINHWNNISLTAKSITPLMIFVWLIMHSVTQRIESWWWKGVVSS